MECLICGNSNWITKHQYGEPDKYEKWQKIEGVLRSWMQCATCGFYYQVRNYPLSHVEAIYKNGYRNPRFRGKSIKECYEQVWNLNHKDSENYRRFEQYSKWCDVNSVLDIGSGLGVWAALLKSHGANVVCMEENEISIDFISNELKIPCYDSLDKVQSTFEVVTLLHVLEHIENPVLFLQNLKRVLYADVPSQLFIEVPDSSEFGYLPAGNDEFNSCHLYFYDMASLYKIIERSGFKVTDMHREYYPKRKLTRLMAVAEICN